LHPMEYAFIFISISSVISWFCYFMERTARLKAEADLQAAFEMIEIFDPQTTTHQLHFTIYPN